MPYPRPAKTLPAKSIYGDLKMPIMASHAAIAARETTFTFDFRRRIIPFTKNPGSMIARKNAEIMNPENELSIL